jgi:cell division protein FtsW
LPATAVGERIGWSITILVIGLTLFGLVMVLSATSVSSVHTFDKSPFYTFSRQLRYAVIGAAAFIVGSRVSYPRFAPLAIPAGIISAVLLTAVLIPGVGSSVNGSSRWLALGPVVIQPAELAKLALILMVARILGAREHQMHLPERTIRPVLSLVILYSLLLILQPKLGTPIIMGTVAILMLFVAKARIPHLVGWALAGLAGATILAYSAPYRRARVFAFLDPWATADSIGLQTVQSQIGIASGGLFGRGLGGSRAKWGFLPEAQTDFIFAVVAEELGAIGALALVLAFGLLGYLGFTAALRAPDAFGRFLAAGLTIWIVTQAALNIGMALGLMPITGEPLPFVSAGGSSLVTTLFASGLLVGVARRGRA